MTSSPTSWGRSARGYAKNPKLSQELSATWVGGVTLTPTEVEEVFFLPEGALQSSLQDTLERAQARTDKLNRLKHASHNGAAYKNRQ
jgi:hypothetical protein